MKKFKRLGVAALAVAMLLSFAACKKTQGKGEHIPFNYDLSPYITLGTYKGVQYVPFSTDPTNELVWDYIITALDSCGLYAKEMYTNYIFHDLTETKVRYGDIVYMDIMLTVDGTDNDDGSATEFLTEIGLNLFTSNITEAYATEKGIDYSFLTQFMTDIEAAAVGKQVGEAFTLSGILPEDNFDTGLIGKNYIITCKVTTVDTRYSHPDTISDEVLETLGSYEDFDQYKNYIESILEDDGANTSEGEIWHRICYDFMKLGYYDYTLHEYYAENLTEGVVAFGDAAVIDFDGHADGELIEDLCSENYTLVIGSNTFIPGFESGLIGAEIGSTVTLDLTFPASYHNESLAGKDARFDVTVKSVSYRYNHPDELPQIIMNELVYYNVTQKTVFSEYYEECQNAVRATLEQEAESRKQSDVWGNVKNNCTISSLPEDEYQLYMDEYIEYYTQIATYYGYESLEEYISLYGYTYNDFYEMGKTYADSDVKNALVLYAIARAEGIDRLDDATYEKNATTYIEYYGVNTYAELQEQLGIYYAKELVMSDMVLKLVCDAAVAVTE